MDKYPLKVAFLDVGHGDSIVIILPSNNDIKKAIVIDTPNAKKTIDYLEKNNVKTLDMVFISHFDMDHSRGISALIKYFSMGDRCVKKVYYSLDRINRVGDEKINYINLVKQLVSFDKNHNIANCSPIVDEFEKYIIQDTENDLYLSILYPNQAELADAHVRNNYNDTSITMMLNYKGNKILFTGDLEGKGWSSLIKRSIKFKKDIKCNTLKMPHHGAFYKDNGTDDVGTIHILDSTQPQYAVISTAQNAKYKHPQKLTINELRVRGIKTICTQATEICHIDRESIQKNILDTYEAQKEEYENNWCPCSGDIIITLDNDIKIEPELSLTNEIKMLFDSPQCI